MRKFTLAAVAALLLGTTPAMAAPITITFDGLSNFANYSEDGFDGISNAWWNFPGGGMAHFDWDSADIFQSDLSDFSAVSVDLLGAGGGGTAIFNGFLDNVIIAQDLFSGAGSFLFSAAFNNIDRLEISYFNDHFTIDNLVLDAAVSEVPEPATLGLFGAGLLAVVAAHRRRSSRK